MHPGMGYVPGQPEQTLGGNVLLCGELVLDKVLKGSGLGGSLLEAGLDFLREEEGNR